jgi:hypothetical protein
MNCAHTILGLVIPNLKKFAQQHLIQDVKKTEIKTCDGLESDKPYCADCGEPTSEHKNKEVVQIECQKDYDGGGGIYDSLDHFLNKIEGNSFRGYPIHALGREYTLGHWSSYRHYICLYATSRESFRDMKNLLDDLEEFRDTFADLWPNYEFVMVHELPWDSC